ncbi:DUF4349 domain-containing protein [[Eubacterium] cellulosolvens]
MSRKFILGLSIFVIILLGASFFIGFFYLPSSSVERYDQFVESQSTIYPEFSAGESVPKPASESGDTLIERMLIYNAYITLETEDISGTLLKIKTLVEGYSGYVAGSSRSTQGERAVADITIRVPNEQFHQAILDIEGYGKVIDERTSSEDVTEQYIDVKARLENLQRQEKRLYEILDMAQTVEEILNVEKELERIRGQIESFQGQVNYLERSVAMSVITIHLIEPPQPLATPGLEWGKTFETAIIGFFTVLRGLIILVTSLLPLAIIGIPLYYIYRKRKQKKR